MVTIRKYTDQDREVWDNFSRNSKSPMFIFERNFVEYHKHRFTDHSLMFYNDDKLIALLPMNEDGNKLFSHAGLTYGGFITNTQMNQSLMNECFDVLIGYAKENGFVSILYKAVPHIYHEQPAEEDRYALFLHNAEIAKMEPATVVNLRNPLKISRGRKSHISKSKREGVEIRVLTEEADFYAYMNLVDCVLGEHHGTKAVHSGEEMYRLYSYFPNNIHLYGAFLKGELIAGSIFYEYNQMVHATYLAAGDVARELGALDYVISVVMEDFKDTKLWCDFGISSEEGGRRMNEGLVIQKERFGGRTNVYDTWLIKID